MPKYLTDEQRKCPYTVFSAVQETIMQYGNARLDCGHLALYGYSNEVVLEQGDDGRFIAICKDCSKKGMEKESIENRNEGQYHHRSGLC